MPNDGIVDLGESFSGPAGEGQWSLVVGGIPVVLHEHGGWRVPVNHNYIELRDSDGDVMRRIHSREVGETSLDGDFRMRFSGEMLTGVYGSEHLPFTEDVIGNNDPHETNPNMLRDGADPEYVGAIVTGTPEQILGVYHQTLEGVVSAGNSDFRYNAAGLGLNGNTMTGEFVEITHRAAEAQGLEVTSFNPRGLDLDFGDGEIDSSAVGGEICYETHGELLAAIDQLEIAAAEQHEMTIADPAADTDTQPAQGSLLRCDHSGGPGSGPGQ